VGAAGVGELDGSNWFGVSVEPSTPLGFGVLDPSPGDCVDTSAAVGLGVPDSCTGD
jgi:hypothetical protein